MNVMTKQRMRQMSSAKDQMVKIIQEQPDNISYDDLLRELAFTRRVERGLAGSDARRTIGNEEMRRRIRT
jgi:predicted Zn-dependent protease